mgnify:CR=1 FL=1
MQKIWILTQIVFYKKLKKKEKKKLQKLQKLANPQKSQKKKYLFNFSLYLLVVTCNHRQIRMILSSSHFDIQIRDIDSFHVDKKSWNH